MQRQDKGHSVQGNPELSTIHPVHEGKDQDPTGEESEEDDYAVDSVQPAVVQTQLDIRGQIRSR